MRALFLVAGIDGPSCRFRVLQYLPYLRTLGMSVDVLDTHGSNYRRLQLLRAAASYDVVCVHRLLLNAVEQRVLRHAAPRYLFDFDDAVFFRDSFHPPHDSWQRRGRFHGMARYAAQTIAGNAYLAQWAERCGAAVQVIPTVIDVDAYSQRTARSSKDLVIGWIGTSMNLPYLRAVVPALQVLAKRRPGVKLKIVCSEFLDVPGVDVVEKPWSLADEIADVMSFDVGIMPLPDDPWTRGKCALKILQYFAAGIPVVCSPVGMNREIVEPGRNGYFAETQEEWMECLLELSQDVDLRQHFGANGRALVEKRYSLAVQRDAFVRALTSVSSAAPT